jgi:diaminopropionate ammonia-lyase
VFFTHDELDSVRRFYSSQADAPATPLHRLAGLAAQLGLNEILLKDESHRFGLPAFKILGTRYAVARLRDRGPLGDLACATAGNHGRAVARAARLAGLTAHVYVPRGTAPARIAAIQGEGAHVVQPDADYDDCVRLMARDASARGWTIVSDTAWPGYDQVPKWIMAGYAWLLEEAARDWGAGPPDVVIVQAGVGSLAGAVAGWLEASFGAARPRLVVVEPHGSACVAASLQAGAHVSLERTEPTSMVGLRCAEVSSIAWPVLARRVDAAVQVSDDDARAAMAALARPSASDPVIVTAASGAAGVAGLVRLAWAPDLAPLRARLDLSPRSRVLAIVTEGWTDR